MLVERLIFNDGNKVTRLYGEDSSPGPYTYNTTSFTIQFQSNTSSGDGKFNIQIKGKRRLEGF
jgi:hypothetical protein